MESIKELRKICQNKGYQEDIITRFHRIFSIYITRIFLILRLKPNFVSILGFFAGIIGGYFYLYSNFLYGSIFFYIFYIFDNVDGEIARYYKISSNFGAWLDRISVHLLYPYFFFTLGLGVFGETGEFQYYIFGSLAAMSKLLERSITSRGIEVNTLKLLNKRKISLVKECANNIAKVSVQYPAILLCSFFGWEELFLNFYGIYLVFFSLGKVFLNGWRIYLADICSQNNKNSKQP